MGEEDDADAAYIIAEDDARTLTAEGYRIEPVGETLEPRKLIVFASPERMGRIEPSGAPGRCGHRPGARPGKLPRAPDTRARKVVQSYGLDALDRAVAGGGLVVDGKLIHLVAFPAQKRTTRATRYLPGRPPRFV